jgi:hypothetical protein
MTTLPTPAQPPTVTPIFRIGVGLAGTALFVFLAVLARSNAAALATIAGLGLVLWTAVLIAPTWLVVKWAGGAAQMGQYTQPASEPLTEAAEELAKGSIDPAQRGLESRGELTADATVSPGDSDQAERVRRSAVERLIRESAQQGWELAEQGVLSPLKVDIEWREAGDPRITLGGRIAPGLGYSSEASYTVTWPAISRATGTDTRT